MSRNRKTPNDTPSTHELRKTLAADVEAFLASGKKIEEIPTGFTNQDPMGGRRHIVLGPSRKS
jgi:hypothetical protein|tara:strand:- start:656 stop:844 length:189 start_codon:yes stop_codon:yes gene_type:complete